MSKGLNKATIIGHLGQDPELRHTGSGNAVVNITVATKDKFKDEERTEWHRIVAFSKLAEIIDTYLKKGSLVYLQGRLQTRKWQGEDGQDRYTTEIVAERMKMLGGKGDRETRATNGKPVAAQTPFDDDIPF